MDQCRATTPSGERCRIHSGLSVDGLCLWHDPGRQEEAAEARVRGSRETALQAREARAARIRVVDPEHVPPLESLDDAVTASAWLYRSAVSGLLDPTTVREANRSITTFKDALNKRDLLQRIRELERQLKAFERART